MKRQDICVNCTRQQKNSLGKKSVASSGGAIPDSERFRILFPESIRGQEAQGTHKMSGMLELGNRQAREAGTRHHWRKAVTERIAGMALTVGWLIVVLAIVVILARALFR